MGVRARFYDPLTGKKGPPLTIHARQAVMVAASAIQTPLLLQASGIGRQSGLVGKRFQAHPGAALLGIFEQPVKMWFGATQGYESTHFWNERMKFETIVVGPDCQSHELPGLYVIDSSCFPTNLGVNPQHTIMALAWVAAQRV